MIGKLLLPFTRSKLETVKQVNKILRENGLTQEDLEQYLKETRNATLSISEENEQPSNMRKGFVRKPTRKCPNCGGIVKLFSIDETHSKWECCKTCSQDPCGWIEIMDKSIEEVIAMEVNQNGLR